MCRLQKAIQVWQRQQGSSTETAVGTTGICAAFRGDTMLYVLLVVRILHAILGTAAATSTIKGSLQQSRLPLYRWSVCFISTWPQVKRHLLLPAANLRQGLSNSLFVCWYYSTFDDSWYSEQPSNFQVFLTGLNDILTGISFLLTGFNTTV